MADEAQIRDTIKNTSDSSQNQEYRSGRDPRDAAEKASKMESTNFLKSTGLLDGYESVVSTMVEEGWPAEQSIFEHAAYLLLKWQTEN